MSVAELLMSAVNYSGVILDELVSLASLLAGGQRGKFLTDMSEEEGEARQRICFRHIFSFFPRFVVVVCSILAYDKDGLCCRIYCGAETLRFAVLFDDRMCLFSSVIYFVSHALSHTVTF